ncbi:hypothetical protein [Prolixibacter sp. NT017]|uniref:hypothetical protein n=1 Tax=Prolixibacter sp. NT017 TaxID=2652390 RepID=UPI0012744209|nr:hypothetical protein [Prolixibacter sp. NT017]GET25704.1 hypothetical protein NT017_20330 [Prolixibacter sp. NT017]
MKKILSFILLFAALFSFNRCENNIKGTNDLNYVTFEATAIDMGVDLNGTTTGDVKVYTTQKTGSDRTFNINVITDETSADPEAYDVPASVTVPANSNVGTLTIGISDVNIGENGETLVLDFQPQEGLFRGKSTTITITQICPYNEVILNMNFDSYPEESYWDLTDADGNVVASVPAGTYDGMEAARKKFCLTDGTYTFTMRDAYGDGITAPGGYSLSYNGTVIASGDEFGTEDATTFTVP